MSEVQLYAAGSDQKHSLDLQLGHVPAPKNWNDMKWPTLYPCVPLELKIVTHRSSTSYLQHPPRSQVAAVSPTAFTVHPARALGRRGSSDWRRSDSAPCHLPWRTRATHPQLLRQVGSLRCKVRKALIFRVVAKSDCIFKFFFVYLSDTIATILAMFALWSSKKCRGIINQMFAYTEFV